MRRSYKIIETRVEYLSERLGIQLQANGQTLDCKTVRLTTITGSRDVSPRLTLKEMDLFIDGMLATIDELERKKHNQVHE